MPQNPLLPVNNTASTVAANQQVEEELKSQDKRRKRGKYQHYDAEVRAKIAKYASEHGNKAAATHFTRELGRTVSEC